MIHDENPVMDVERRIDVDVDVDADIDAMPIVEEYVFPESPNQTQHEEPLAEPEVADTLEIVTGDLVEEPILTNVAPINRHRKPWSDTEIARLYREYQINRYTIDEIAEMHGRTYFAIVGKLKSENILYNVSDEEDEYLEEVESESDEEEAYCQVQLPSAFLIFARGYCHAVGFLVDVVFAGVTHIYRTFVPYPTDVRRKRKNR